MSTLPNSFIKTLQAGAESVLPEHFIIAVRKGSEAVKNVNKFTIYSLLAIESGLALGNTVLAVRGWGGAIVLMSGKNYFQTESKIAKVCYVLSFICSGTGTISSSIAVYCDRCGLSKTAMLGHGFGGLFLKACDFMNKAGRIAEGK